MSSVPTWKWVVNRLNAGSMLLHLPQQLVYLPTYLAPLTPLKSKCHQEEPKVGKCGEAEFRG